MLSERLINVSNKIMTNILGTSMWLKSNDALRIDSFTTRILLSSLEIQEWHLPFCRFKPYRFTLNKHSTYIFAALNPTDLH